MTAQPLDRNDFAALVRNAPLVAIDLLLRDPGGAVLVGLRTNPPAQQTWFVPGGRIRKNERRADAFARILFAETGLTDPFSAARLAGTYDHIYPDNHFSETGYNAHYVVLGYELKLATRPVIRADEQHHALRWLSPAELLADPDVHENTKAYFR